MRRNPPTFLTIKYAPVVCKSCGSLQYLYFIMPVSYRVISVRQTPVFDFVSGKDETFLSMQIRHQTIFTVIYKFLFNCYFISWVLRIAKTTPVVVFGCTLYRVAAQRRFHVNAFFRVTRRTPNWLSNTSPTSTTTSDIWSPFRPSHRITWPVSRWAIDTLARLLNPSDLLLLSPFWQIFL